MYIEKYKENIKYTLLASALLLVLVFAISYYGNFRSEPYRFATIPDFELVTFSGEKHSMSEFLGKKHLIINFWAAWCSFCKEETLVLERLKRDFYDKDLEIIGIHRPHRESVEAGREFIEEIDVNYPVFLGGDEEEIYNFFTLGADITPSSVLITKNGDVHSIEFGWRTEEYFIEKIEEMIDVVE
ncbi:hypothetical protein CL631_02400 [bacterium]|jgi:peroxiredoxin|nr:hypothetical protein [bacterium]MDP6659755.1 TlpA disulfide reductase family protein [Candidatus Paceibacterota bacterium]|tara:strand:+ start:1355 stop:1909 length:555 start_codon:yes stop_codon:yes gene_type:complete